VQSKKAVSQVREKSDKNEFPDDELNPLVNPLLAANMGRWAEVYFTNPPERRNQAVTELIHELQTSAKPQPHSGQASSIDIAHQAPRPMRVPIIAAEAPANSDVHCAACGQLNPEGQRFCGMCGSLLDPQSDQVLAADQSERDTGSGPYTATRSFYGEGQDSDEAVREIAPNPSYDRFEFATTVPEDELPSFARESAPVPYRYRIYVGAFVAVVLAALIYFARYHTGFFSSDQESPAARAIPAAQSGSEASEPAQEAPVPVEKAERNQTPASPKVANPPSTPQEPVAPGQRDAEASLPQTSSHPVRSALPSGSVSAAASGTEELAEAEKYLSQRDGGEAAQWLWKAVAKGNGPGAVELADLYLRGDGVAKNCDQGRLLLDVAARKGIKGAAIQLQNLQAFGCR
jgi:hypothetical protein